MKKIWMLLPFSFLALHCSGDLPLSDLINNTVTLKMLGTYESNDPYGRFSTLPQDDIIAAFTNASPALNGTPLQTYAQALANDTNLNRLRYYIDIAEIRLAEGQGKSSSQAISDYWSQFAITRQLMCSEYATAEAGRNLANCSDSNGIQRLADFFNGGFTYPAVDVASGFYNHMGIYFRRFATGPAAFFNGDGTYSNGTQTSAGNQTTAEAQMTTTFDNRSIYGRDIETLLQAKYGETPTEPMMFPLQRKDLSLRVTNGAEPYVLETRVFIQNLMMVHVKQITNDTSTSLSAANGAMVYVAPSDWNVDHAFKDQANFDKQGGSLLMTARVYQPANVGRLQMNATFTTTTNKSYFVAVVAGTTFDPLANLPLVATAATNNTLTNLPPGTYDVYRTCDVKRCDNVLSTTGGTCVTSNGVDGFPETHQLCEANKVVTKDSVTSVLTATCTTITNCN